MPPPRLNIIVDTREQRPWEFPDHNVTRRTLPAGDYSLAVERKDGRLVGYEDRFALERKSLPDLIGTITTDRERFLRELRSLRRFDFAAIIVEASWEDVYSWNYMPNVTPQSIVGSLLAFQMDFGVGLIMAGDRTSANAMAEQLMRLYVTRQRRMLRAAEEIGGEE